MSDFSRGEVGVCWENAVAESIFLHADIALVTRPENFSTKLDARIIVGAWAWVYYNRRRIHSTTFNDPCPGDEGLPSSENPTATMAA